MAAQLKAPSGADGLAVAKQMNENNGAANLAAIELLGLQSGHRVLEIGPGNGGFVGAIVSRADHISYTGVDWSADMVGAATALNRVLVDNGRVCFEQASSAALPYGNASFDRAVAVHTLYFWDSPTAHLKEIRRVLSPGGKFCLAFGDRQFMAKLPFTEHGFNLYDDVQATALLTDCGFSDLNHHVHRETGRSNDGSMVEKTINIICAGISAA